MSVAPWNVIDGMKLVLSIGPIAEKYGYTIAVGGKVVEGKETTGALRLFGIPFYHNKTDRQGLMRKLSELWGEYDHTSSLNGPEPDPMPPGWGGDIGLDEPPMPPAPRAAVAGGRRGGQGRLVRDPRPGLHQGQWIPEAQIRPQHAVQRLAIEPEQPFFVQQAWPNFAGLVPVGAGAEIAIVVDAVEGEPKLKNPSGRTIYQESVRFYRDQETIDIHFLG